MQNKFPEDKDIYDIPSIDSIYETILDTPPSPPPPPQPLSLAEKSSMQTPTNNANFRPSNAYQMPVQGGKSQSSAIAENTTGVSVPCTGPPAVHPESYNKLQYGACSALGTDNDEEVPPDYSSLQIIDTQLDSSSGKRASTSSSYLDMMEPENSETGYDSVENEKGRSDGTLLDADPKAGVKGESNYQEILQDMKEPDGEYARPNVQP